MEEELLLGLPSTAGLRAPGSLTWARLERSSSLCCCSCGQRGKVRQPPRTLGALTSPLYAGGLYGKRGAGEWDPAGCHPVNAGPKEETALFMAEETTATAWCWVRYSHTVLRDCRGSCGAQGLRPHSEYSSVSGLPNPWPRASRTRSLGALAHTYPFLEVGPPLVVLPDHNLNATLPVFALCGDGLQPRGRNEKQVLGGDSIAAHEYPVSITEVASGGSRVRKPQCGFRDDSFTHRAPPLR